MRSGCVPRMPYIPCGASTSTIAVSNDVRTRCASMRASQLAAARDALPRHICPPGALRSSTSSTELPLCAAVAAAARPAGPAPITTMTAVIAGDDVQAVARRDETCALTRHAVDRDTTLEARAHAAQRRARLAGLSRTERSDPCIEQRSCDRHIAIAFDPAPVH